METSDGSRFWITGLKKSQRKQLQEDCCVIGKFEDENGEFPVVDTSLRIISKKRIGIPRFHPFSLSHRNDDTVDNRILGTPISFAVTAKPRKGQKPCFKEFKKELENGKTGFLIEASPGSGKTVLSLKFIQTIGTTALVVVPKTDLVTQWKNRFLEHTDLKESEIGTVIAQDANWQNKKVVIALVHSLNIGYLSPAFDSYFGQVWYDEVHTTCPPPTFAPIAGKFPAKYRGSLSATPDRSDGLHTVFEWHIAETKIKCADSERMPVKVVIPHWPEFYGPVTGESPLQRRGMLISLMARNKIRNRRLAKRIVKRYNQGHRVVVISDSTYQLFKLKELLINEHGISILDVGYYCDKNPEGKGKVKKKDLEYTVDSAQIILSTYGMMKLGTDIPNMSAMIYATPQSDPRQSKGRVERFHSEKMQPVLDDPWDDYYQETRNWARAREKYYMSEQLDVRHLR
jgi:superfamily II DNA or RNA helicase